MGGLFLDPHPTFSEIGRGRSTKIGGDQSRYRPQNPVVRGEGGEGGGGGGNIGMKTSKLQLLNKG